MKKLKRFVKVLAAFALLSVGYLATKGNVAFAQCDSDEFLNKCSSALGAFTYIKTYNVEQESPSDSHIQSSYVFSKGSTYILIICDGNKDKGDKMTVKLFDRNKQEIASNRKGSKTYPSITYPCSATGVYYIESFFEGKKGGCGINILGFQKN